jgi:hypothetical protein
MKQEDHKLAKSMAKLGYPMMLPTEELDVNQTLAEVVKSRDLRYWEGFPVLLATAIEDFEFSPEFVEQLLDTKTQKYHFHNLLILSSSLFAQYHISSPWLRKFKGTLSNDDAELFRQFRYSLAHDKSINWKNKSFDTERLKNTFELYFENKAEKSDRQQQKYGEFSLEFAMSRIFPPKQKELFKKKLNGLPLNKTEQEYYSRVVKKKIVALANSQLHNLARILIEK